jgi:hypothetical protein
VLSLASQIAADSANSRANVSPFLGHGIIFAMVIARR